MECVAGGGGACQKMILKEAPVIFFSPFPFHISIPQPFNLLSEALTAGNTLNGNPLFKKLLIFPN